jgi:hypothetical protein
LLLEQRRDRQGFGSWPASDKAGFVQLPAFAQSRKLEGPDGDAPKSSIHRFEYPYKGICSGLVPNLVGQLAQHLRDECFARC